MLSTSPSCVTLDFSDSDHPSVILPQECVCSPRDTWQCLEACLFVTAGSCHWHLGVEARDAAECPAVHRTAPQQSRLALNVSQAEVEKL